MTRRFNEGWTGVIDGVRLRVTKGEKLPDDDLVMEMFVEGEWRVVRMGLVAVMTDFLCENEGYLYPEPQYRGGWKFLDFLAKAKIHGYAYAVRELEAEKTAKRLREQQEATG